MMGALVPASAAPVSYQITSLASDPILCAANDPANEAATCNASVVNAAASPAFSGVSIFPAVSAPIRIFDLLTVGKDTGGDDAFSFRLTVGVLINSVDTFFYRMTANVSGWKPTGNGSNPNGNVAANSTQITFTDPDFDAGSPIQVGFVTLSPFQGTSIPLYFTVAALEPAVVPLPAGVLLLGTALLGLFGLSRRRKLAAA